MKSNVCALRPGCILELDHLRAQVDGRVVSLTAREADVLRILLEREGQDVRLDELHQLWEPPLPAGSRAAQQVVHRLRGKLERDPSHPRHLITVYGVGFRLEREHDRLLGRAALVREVQQLLADHRLVTLTGLGGIGKTRLATAILDDVGGLFVGAAAVRDRAGLLQAVATTLGIRQGDDPVGQLGAALAARGPSLVVLDNVEQITEPTREILGAWLDVAPQVRWLVTSRVRVGITGETLCAVPALAVPEPGQQDARHSPSVQLLVQRATGPLGDDASVTELARRLEGIPLALELAAARTDVLDAAGILTRLDTLRVLRRKGTGRQDAMAHTLAWSWSLLSEVERSVLAQCSLFQTPFRVEAAEAVVSVPDDVLVLDVLQALVDASLIELRPGDPHRLSLYAMVREFAAESLHDTDAPRRHAQWFARWGDPAIASHEVDMADLAAELTDLELAADNAVHSGWAAPALDLARALALWTSRHGRVLGARERVEAALRLGDASPEHRHQRLELRIAWSACLLRANRIDELQQIYPLALADDPTPEQRAAVVRRQALCLARLGRSEDARALIGTLPAGVGSRHDQAATLIDAGYIAVRCDALQGARKLLERALLLADGYPDLQHAVHAYLGMLYASQMQWEQALHHVEAGLGRARELGDISQVAAVVERRGMLELDAGRPAAAARSFDEADARFSRCGVAAPYLSGRQALVALDLDDPQRARVLAAEAVRATSGANSPVFEAWNLTILAQAAMRCGDPADALHHAARAAELLPPQATEMKQGLAMARVLATAHQGDPEARVLLESWTERVGPSLQDRAQALLVAAEVEVVLGDRAAAERAIHQFDAAVAGLSVPRLVLQARLLRERHGLPG